MNKKPKSESDDMRNRDHLVPIGGAIEHNCLDQWCTSGTQNRCSGGRSHLNWTIISAMDAGSQKAQQKKYGGFQEFWTAVYRPYACYQR